MLILVVFYSWDVDFFYRFFLPELRVARNPKVKTDKTQTHKRKTRLTICFVKYKVLQNTVFFSVTPHNGLVRRGQKSKTRNYKF